jgi:hypothetical protein
MKRYAVRNFIFGLGLVLSTLGIMAPQAHARADGAIWWAEDPEPTGDSQSYITYYTKQGAQGTSWVWRVQKYYPEFTVYCSTSHTSGCNATKSEGRYEEITKQWTVGFDLSPTFKKQGGSFGFDWSQSKTEGSNFQIGQTLYMKSGYTAYAMIIALDKYIPAADQRGAWLPTGKKNSVTCFKEFCSTRKYEMKWHQNHTIGNWSGHMITHARSYMCATRTTTELNTGNKPPAGCSLPPIPY